MDPIKALEKNLTIRQRVQIIAAYEILILVILCILLALCLCVAYIVVTRNNGDDSSPPHK
jgi:hypothetical protein